ncbi:hypothetical protein LCGC14_0224370 [marine sediment metagenome]|uniref:Uncharacterized protein n=1 Tax=marine sediment metagenome TaxID=412755 RepID=A0A0F9UGS6_9ZZZZ
MSEIENLKIDKAEAIQKYRELEETFKKLFSDAFFLWNYIKINMNSPEYYIQNSPEYKEITKTWEFDK